ncbi:hypothetical protein EMCRGX_G027320 [Ephydatia muelleri]
MLSTSVVYLGYSSEKFEHLTKPVSRANPSSTSWIRQCKKVEVPDCKMQKEEIQVALQQKMIKGDSWDQNVLWTQYQCPMLPSAIAPATNLQIALDLDVSISVQGTTKLSDSPPIYTTLQFQPYRDRRDRSS